MSAIFVTATGTDIGKTFVTTGLVRALRAEGRMATAIKPVVSGFEMATAERSDPGLLLQAMAEVVTPQSLALVSPWRFRAPLSPDMASAREGRIIDFAELVAFCRDAIAAESNTLLIEGVGGLMVPIDRQHTVLDWIGALDIPAILVAGTYLGTISHTLTALDVLARRGIVVRALVLNESSDAPVPIAETRDAIAAFAPEVPIAVIPRAQDSTLPIEAFRQLCRLMI